MYLHGYGYKGYNATINIIEVSMLNEAVVLWETHAWICQKSPTNFLKYTLQLAQKKLNFSNFSRWWHIFCQSKFQMITEITLQYIYISISTSENQYNHSVALCKLENIRSKHNYSIFTYLHCIAILQISTVIIHRFYELIVMLLRQHNRQPKRQRHLIHRKIPHKRLNLWNQPQTSQT